MTGPFRTTVVTSLLLGALTVAIVPRATARQSTPLIFHGDAAELQRAIDEAPEGATIDCAQAGSLLVSQTITIRRPLTLQGLDARLPEKLGNTTLLVVAAPGVTLRDLSMTGNYDSVDQADRAPFIHIQSGDFLVERCRFVDGSKDGIMVTPLPGTGDLVNGTIRAIQGLRMGRDVVSLSGGCRGQRVRDITVENVQIDTGYFRGAVEVSDGSHHITVRNVSARKALYAVDVQDHGAQVKGSPLPSAPNTDVTIENIIAVDCRLLIRTANHPLGHADLTIRNASARNCAVPVQISNTRGIRLQNLVIVDDTPVAKPRITLKNCEDVELRHIAVTGLAEGTTAIDEGNSKNVTIEALILTPAEATP